MRPEKSYNGSDSFSVLRDFQGCLWDNQTSMRGSGIISEWCPKLFEVEMFSADWSNLDKPRRGGPRSFFSVQIEWPKLMGVILFFLGFNDVPAIVEIFYRGFSKFIKFHQ